MLLARWTPELTADLLELIKANPSWRHTFFSYDSARLPAWKEARDVLCLLCRKKEQGLMLAMEKHGLVSAKSTTASGAIIWKPTEKWNRADIVTNRAASHLTRLVDSAVLLCVSA